MRGQVYSQIDHSGMLSYAPTLSGRWVYLLIDKKTAKKFSIYMDKYSKLYHNLAKIIFNNLPRLPSKSRIVDIGMGPGLLLSEVHKLIPEAILLGIDPSINMLENSLPV